MAVEKLGVAALASVVGFAGLSAIGQPARACGGCFGPPGASAPVAEHAEQQRAATAGDLEQLGQVAGSRDTQMTIQLMIPPPNGEST